MKSKKDLLILGGGYGGTTLVHALKNIKDINITLINQTPFHIVQTEIHRYLGGAINEDSIYFDLEEFCHKNNANFICDKAVLVNDKENYVTCKSGKNVAFDYLVIATGSVSFFPHQIQNIQEYSQDIKIAEHLKSFQKEFDELLASEEEHKNIAIIGGGLTGTEIALEYATRLSRLGIKEKCSVSLIEQLPTLLPGASAALIEQSTKACDNAGIQRYHGNYVTKIEDKKIYLSNDTTIPFSMVVITIGVTSEQLLFQNTIEKSPRNQFFVTPSLHVKGYEHIFAIGDVAYFEDEEGKCLLPTAQNAKQQAKTVAKTIKNIINNKPNITYKYKHKGTLVDLSKNRAIGDAFGIQFHGKSAYSLKRTVNAMHTKIFK
jgi:NADH dehydrogenase